MPNPVQEVELSPPVLRQQRPASPGSIRAPQVSPDRTGEAARPAAVAQPQEPAARAANESQLDIGLSAAEHALKRAFDLASVVVILALFGWLMVLIAIAIRLGGGSRVIYGHTRVGRDGVPFECYKFRSMVPDAGAVLSELLARDPAAREEWDRDFKLRNDPRITRVGRFIRKTSLDELPQLWNVLVGEMSIVGPRPVVQDEFDFYYGAAKHHYLSVPPGLTGLWQVSGRNDLNYDERVRLDASYVDRWNVFTDFAIVMRTVKVMLLRRGAY